MTPLNQEQRDKLNGEIAVSLHDSAVLAVAASQMTDPNAQSKALLECISLAQVATDHARYLRGIVNQ